jgi:uracil-DNA glycosylase
VPCRGAAGEAAAPVVWSRRNGPWRRVDVLVIGAAPGNDGGRGDGARGAHGTRIPFGGDIAGANLDVLLASIGRTRDDTFIAAALNRLPERGGGEPRVAELASPAGAFADSVEALRATVLASGATLVVALGNVALRACIAASARERSGGPLRLPGLARIEAQGFRRGVARRWPEGAGREPGAARAFRDDWARCWPGAALPLLLWLLHPSAQNMSPHAGRRTHFHRRMVDTRAALVRAAGAAGIGPAPRPTRPTAGRSVYGTPEWTERVAPRHAPLVELWRRKGL